MRTYFLKLFCAIVLQILRFLALEIPKNVKTFSFLERKSVVASQSAVDPKVARTQTINTAPSKKT